MKAELMSFGIVAIIKSEEIKTYITYTISESKKQNYMFIIKE